jgi:hypothetical protein
VECVFAIEDEPGLNAVKGYVRRLRTRPGVPAEQVAALRGLAYIIRAT